MNNNGEAISYYKGIKIVCSGLLQNEIAKVKVIKANKNVAFAKVVNIIKTSEFRVESQCENKVCTACPLIFSEYSHQLEIKSEILSEVFGKKIKMNGSDQFCYRNKAVLPVGVNKGKIMIGIYRRNTHDIIDYSSDCVVLNSGMNSIIKLVKTKLEVLKPESIPLNLFIRGADRKFQVGFILRTYSENAEKVLKEIINEMDIISSVFYSIVTKTNSLAISDPVFVEGEQFCKFETINGKYKLSPSSFFQANISILDKILGYIGSIISELKTERILDLYSGCGVLSNFSGINRTCTEINPAAFDHIEKDDKSKFIVSGISGITNEISDGRYNLIIADPPRKGIDKYSVEAINNSGAGTFIYLSCDPKTQKRDIEILTNYELQEVTGFDMFPNTMHIESLAVLKRK